MNPPDAPVIEPPTPPQPGNVYPTPGGLTFREAAPMLCGVVDNGVCADDPRVMVRTNEATKIVLDAMIPVGGMAVALVQAIDTIVWLPPEMENVIEAVPYESSTKVFGKKDIRQGWYEIINESIYLDPAHHHDNPLVDLGMWPDPNDSSILRRVYQYPGLQPTNAVVTVTGAKRFIPIKSEDDYLIVQNIEALKCIILSIERYENNDPDGAVKFRQTGLELLQSEVKKHILDPRNYMRRKADYQRDLTIYPEHSMGYIRAQMALDVEGALKTGKQDLTWHINQAECRLMKRAIYKDTIIEFRAEVTDGYIYFPLNVGSVLAIDLNGAPIPIRNQFFEYLENGPGQWGGNPMLVDEGDHYFPGSKQLRRKYRLNACYNQNHCISTICKLRWLPKEPADLMVIKNYEALRLMVAAKFMEEGQRWNEAQANQNQAFEIMDKELRDYLAGIRHTVHIQTYGFGLGDVCAYGYGRM